jgi:hypothetical protein
MISIMNAEKGLSKGVSMRLAPQETERFYRIWFALLHYVNEQLHLVPDLTVHFCAILERMEFFSVSV